MAEKRLKESPKGQRSLAEILEILKSSPPSTEPPPEEQTGGAVT